MTILFKNHINKLIKNHSKCFINIKKIYIFFSFFLDLNIENIEREINVQNCTYRSFKYSIPSRPVRFINNLNDTTTVLPTRLVGGYQIIDPNEVNILSTTSIMENTLIELNINVPEQYKRFPINFLIECHNDIYEIMYERIVSQDKIFNFGFMMKFIIQISKQSPNTPDKIEKLYLSTHRYILVYTEIREVLQLIIQWFSNRLEQLLSRVEGSGWVIDRILNFQISYHRVVGINRVGSPLFEYPEIRCRRLIFNPPAENIFDKMCIPKCIAGHILKDVFIYKNKKPNWNYISKLLIKSKNIKRYLNYGKTDIITFDNMHIIENANKLKIVIYCLYYSNDTCRYELSLIRKGSKKYKNKCNLIFYKILTDNNKISWHCFLIKCNIRQFLNNFLVIKLADGECICSYCFTKHGNTEKLKKHKHKFCANKNDISNKIYPQQKSLVFKNFHKTQKLDFLCFYDFEAAFQEINTTEKIHIPIIFSYLIINTKYNQIVDFYTEVNSNPHQLVNSFLERLVNFWSATCPYYQIAFSIHFNEIQFENFERETNCKICLMEFSSDNFKCAHHDHTIEFHNYISALCSRCNLKIIRQKNLIIISHNSSYDMSFLIKYSKNSFAWKILTQKSNLKFYNISVKNLSFVDSFQFLKSSLSNLIKQAQKDNKDFYFFNQIISKKFNITQSDELFKLLKGKLYFPYDFINDSKKLEQTIFPNKKEFYNKLNNTHISQKNYNIAKKIYTLSKCKNLGEYYSLYCEIDVIMLADLYLMNRQFMHQEFKLDMAQYLTLPSYSMDSFLYYKFTKDPYFKIDLMENVDLINLIQSSIRGGFCQLNTHSLVLDDASKLLLNENLNKRIFRKGILVSCIETFDLNSNYPSAMTEPLPIGDFKKLTDIDEITCIIESLKKNEINFQDSEIGYYFYVSLDENNIHVQDLTDEFPFALEKKDIFFDQLGPYTKEKFKNVSLNLKFKRLIGHHFPKNSYFVDGESLQQYLYYGLKLVEVFDIYSYTQKPFLKEFIMKNIELRKQTSCKMDSDLFKLCNNSIFGKTLTNVIHYSTNTILCLNKKSFLKYLCSPYFINYTPIHENKIIITMRKRNINFDYPSFIGYSVLEKAQRYMKTIYYDVIKIILQNNFLSLLYSDTDSFYISYMLSLREYSQEAYFTERYKILKQFKDKNILDCSNFHPKHIMYDETNKGQLFYMKLENTRLIYGAFYGLAPKIYNFDIIPYHIHKIISEIKVQFLNETLNEISVLYIQKTCCIFEINTNDPLIFKIFKTFINKISIMLEGWYKNKLEFFTFIETYDCVGNEILTPPKCQDFYKDEVLTFINEKKTTPSIFYFEINKYYDANFYKYASNFNTRPEMEDDIKSDYELLISSSKACAGVPYSFMHNITLEDYKAALIQNNELKNVSFNIIKNDKYINKTITVSKKILNTCCVKKYMKNERESYSFGYHKIPINFRHNFISDASISSNESNILENISNTSNISSNSISELSDLPLSSNNSSNTPIMSDESCVNIFKNREQKMIQKNIFPENNVISENENNTSNLELSDLCEIPQSSKKTKKNKKNLILYLITLQVQLLPLKVLLICLKFQNPQLQGLKS